MIRAIIVLCLLPIAAWADDTVSWSHPTAFTDGTALDQAEIEATVLRWFADATSTVVEGSVQVPAPAASVVLPRDVLVASTRCYQAATRMKAPNGQQSVFAPSARVCKTVVPPAMKKPKPPTGLAVQ